MENPALFINDTPVTLNQLKSKAIPWLLADLSPKGI